MIRPEKTGESQAIPDRIVQISEALGGRVEYSLDSKGKPVYQVKFGRDQFLTECMPRVSGKPIGVATYILYTGAIYDGPCTMLQIHVHRVETDVDHGKVVFANQMGQEIELHRNGLMRFTEGGPQISS